MVNFDTFQEANAQHTIHEMSNTSDIDGTVNRLSDEQLDNCMKYIYLGLESGEYSNALLKWHESVFNKAGLGSIVRALNRKRNVEKAQ